MGKVADAVAALDEAFRRTLPLNKKRKPTEAEWAAGLREFYKTARKIRQQFDLGIFARARAAYGLQQRLVDAGYPADAVRNVVFSLVLSAFVGKE